MLNFKACGEGKLGKGNRLIVGFFFPSEMVWNRMKIFTMERMLGRWEKLEGGNLQMNTDSVRIVTVKLSINNNTFFLKLKMVTTSLICD